MAISSHAVDPERTMLADVITDLLVPPGSAPRAPVCIRPQAQPPARRSAPWPAAGRTRRTRLPDPARRPRPAPWRPRTHARPWRGQPAPWRCPPWPRDLPVDVSDTGTALVSCCASTLHSVDSAGRSGYRSRHTSDFEVIAPRARAALRHIRRPSREFSTASSPHLGRSALTESPHPARTARSGIARSPGARLS